MLDSPLPGKASSPHGGCVVFITILRPGTCLLNNLRKPWVEAAKLAVPDQTACGPGSRNVRGASLAAWPCLNSSSQKVLIVPCLPALRNWSSQDFRRKLGTSCQLVSLRLMRGAECLPALGLGTSPRTPKGHSSPHQKEWQGGSTRVCADRRQRCRHGPWPGKLSGLCNPQAELRWGLWLRWEGSPHVHSHILALRFTATPLLTGCDVPEARTAPPTLTCAELPFSSGRETL